MVEGIIGDLHEKFGVATISKGRWYADLIYILNALGYLRYVSLKNRNSRSNFEAMFKNYLTITLRSFKKQKVYSFINLFGLSLGIAAGFMILQYVYYEVNYDKHLDNAQNIYRVQQDRFNKGELSTQWASGCAGIGPDMKEAFPEIEKYVKLHSSNTLLKYNNQYLKIKNAYYASEDFFEVFSIPLISGVDSLVLTGLYKVVLSKSMATNLFGDADPLGKIVVLNDRTDFEVVGVFDDLPEQSHMKIDLLYSFSSYVALTSERANTAWNWDGFMTYVQLRAGTDPKSLEAKLPMLIEEKVGEEYEQSGQGIAFHLQPLAQIHLTSNYFGEFKKNGDKLTTYFLLIVGIFLIVIAWINYINLTTARAMQRAREVGIRKVLGSFRRQLINQFLFESAFMNLLSMIVALLLIFFGYPYFNEFVGISDPYSFPTDSFFWLSMLGMLLAGLFLSGFYPALVLSSFKPVDVLKGKFEGSGSGGTLRKVLVVFQFLTSVILITGTFVVYQQMNFLQEQDLGLSIDQTLILRTPNSNNDSTYSVHYNTFRNNLLAEPEISALSSSTSIPGGGPGWNAGGIRLLEQDENEANQYRVVAMDDQYLDLYDVEIANGRKFDDSFGNEENNVIVNESAVKLLGAVKSELILNKKMYFWGDTFNIVGVVKNFRHESPKKAFDPLIFRYIPEVNGFYSLKVSTQNMSQMIGKIEQHWRTSYNEQPFDLFFLDEHYNEQYKSEEQFGSVFGFFAGLAILIACLGLFGLASYATALRTKEVGVRKVLGARVTQLLALLAQDFLKLVSIAIIISIPISYWIINQWLDNFANRISISAYLFFVPSILLIVIALITITYHVLKTASLNPAITLKNE